MHALSLVALAFGLSGCGGPAIDLKNPTPDDLDAALRKFREIGPATKTGRWDVAVSNPNVKLEGVDKEIAEALHAAGKALNTTTRCRKEPYPVDSYTKIAIKVSQRPGCTIDRLTARPDELFYSSKCTIDSSILADETRIKSWPDRFETTRKSGVGYNGNAPSEMRALQYDGHYVGECKGDESVQQALWSDPR